MTIDFSVEDAVRTRRSIRTYEPRTVSDADKALVENFISSLTNPFGALVRFKLLESGEAKNGAKLGTYGVIKGAGSFIGAAVKDGPLALEGLGYAFETLVLYATAIGLGTCWLGGTFNRSGFATAMQLETGELFPAISPLGYALDKLRLGDAFSRRFAKSDERRAWPALFFKNDFLSPLSKLDAGKFDYPFEMLRLAPSAVNKQPWRVVMTDTALHFYEVKGAASAMALDLHRVDVGIGACHFHLAALEKGLNGSFRAVPDAPSAARGMNYLFSYIPD